MAVYHAMAQPGDVIVSAAQPFGGHSSNRVDGPAGFRGLQIVDVPFDPVELEVDLDAFARLARQVQPRLVVMGMSMTLFPLPVREMSSIIAEWGGKLSTRRPPGRVDRRRPVPDPLNEGRGAHRLGGQDVQRAAERHHRLE
jgi:glycine/serine hydroxymethyltransferase